MRSRTLKITLLALPVMLLLVGFAWSASANRKKLEQRDEMADMMREIVNGDRSLSPIGDFVVVEVQRGNLNQNNSSFRIRSEAVVACTDLAEFHQAFNDRFKREAAKRPWLISPAVNITKFGNTATPGNDLAWPASRTLESNEPPSPNQTLIYIRIEASLNALDLGDYMEWLS